MKKLLFVALHGLLASCGYLMIAAAGFPFLLLDYSPSAFDIMICGIMFLTGAKTGYSQRKQAIACFNEYMQARKNVAIAGTLAK